MGGDNFLRAFWRPAMAVFCEKNNQPSEKLLFNLAALCFNKHNDRSVSYATFFFP